jgi:hypothetical protein
MGTIRFTVFTGSGISQDEDGAKTAGFTFFRAMGEEEVGVAGSAIS